MRFIDLSQPLFHECPNCPAHPLVSSTFLADHPADGWRVEMLQLVNHTGSHLDAPLHKLPGTKAIDDIPLDHFAGPAYLADLRFLKAGEGITAEHLKKTLPSDLRDKIVLFATGWGQKRARTAEWLQESPWLTSAGAQYLVEAGIRGVGIDHYTVGGSREPQNSETHTILLSKEIWILEELRFEGEVFDLPQPFTLLALPIHLKGHSGSFCRPVILV